METGTAFEFFDRPVDPVDRLLRRRVVLLSGEIDAAKANDVMARLLWLEQEDDQAPIELRINSPGGELLSGLAIVDTMAQVRCPVATTCAGMAASMASVLLACGTRGRRRATATGHLGLRSMAERIETAGGELELVAALGRGTRVILRLPAPPAG